jgi:hypothetical protein
MHARPLNLAFALIASAALAGCGTVNTISGWLGNKIAFGEPQLQRHLDHNFPREFDKLGGLVSATLSHPRLTIPRDDTRLHLDFDISVSALGAKNISSGNFTLVSGLRYNPATQGLHLHNPELANINMPNAGSLLSGGTKELLNAVLVEYANEQPVYRLDDDLLRKLPAGKHIVSTDIEDGLVVVRLGK